MMQAQHALVQGAGVCGEDWGGVVGLAFSFTAGCFCHMMHAHHTAEEECLHLLQGWG